MLGKTSAVLSPLRDVLRKSVISGSRMVDLARSGEFLSFRVRRPRPRRTWTEVLSVDLRLLDIGKESDIQMVCHSRYNWQPTGWAPKRKPGGKQNDMYDSESWHWTLLWNHTIRKGFFLGGQDPMNDPLRFVLEKGKLKVGSPIRRILPAGSYTSETLLACRTADPLEALEKYGDTFSRLGRTFTGSDRVGWNTFDYYQGTFGEMDALENLESIKKWRKLRKETRWIVLDGGWQDLTGSWKPGPKFSGDFANFCTRVRSAGMVPGIWLGPFLVRNDAPFAKEHPEALLKNVKGKLVVRNSTTSVLDPTHPAAQAFLLHVFRRLKKDGFRYFKIDFLDAVTIYDCRAWDAKLGEIQWIRKGVETIRKAIGWDSYLVGCGTDLASMTGLVDACRIGPDIHVWRSNIRFEARTLSFRWWMNGRLWQNDPDFLVVRGKATSTSKRPLGPRPYATYEPFGHRQGKPIATVHEAQVAATVVLLAGGHVVLSDRLAELTTPGRRIVETALALRSETAARPIDFGASVLASVWYRPGTRPLLAVFNWSDRPATVAWQDGCLHTPLLAGPAREVWTDCTYKEIPSRLRMGAFSVRLFSFPLTR